jgi:hypothetical protein
MKFSETNVAVVSQTKSKEIAEWRLEQHKEALLELQTLVDRANHGYNPEFVASSFDYDSFLAEHWDDVLDEIARHNFSTQHRKMLQRSMSPSDIKEFEAYINGQT